MSPIVLALGASLFYGGADFWATGLARHSSPVAVTTWSQLTSGVVLGLLLFGGVQRFDAGGLGWGIAAGAFGGLGLLLYYRALAAGPAAVVAPLAAAGTAIPVVVGLVRGDSTSGVALVGLAMIMVGIAAVSLTGGSESRVSPPPCGAAVRGSMDIPGPGGDAHQIPTVPLALIAAVLLGSFFVLLDRGTQPVVLSCRWSWGFSSVASPLTAPTSLSGGCRAARLSSLRVFSQPWSCSVA